MKAITIKQPWATLIAKGYKEYEFRTWKTKYRGDILIHAGKKMDKNAMERFKYLNLEYPTGKIIAQATITDCIHIDEEIAQKLYQKDPVIYKELINQDHWDEYGFQLQNVKEVNPIEVNGKLSLWDYNDEEKQI